MLEQTPVLIALGAVAVADFVGDKVPAVDHALRPCSTVTTAGAGNPVLSLVEDGISAVLAFSAIALPLLALLLVLALLAAAWLAIRRLRARRAGRSGAG